MKKQTKSKKSQQSKLLHIKACTSASCRRQRFWAVVALAGLFTCGLMVGMAISSGSSKNIKATDAYAEEPIDLSQSQEDICGEVERLLSRRLPAANDVIEDRIERAKIYTSLAERGCVENSEMFAELAAQELDVARAIDNDNFNHEETIDVVETYKRLHMQAAAEEIFEKAKKLTDPAIDFIIQVEKIINE